uniref:Cell division protein n=1 Tax=Geminella minor TaxID=163309 RepID=A0A097KQ02_GEMMI|nr:cell division protein [Geminella minor]AIT95240.1 cell division protein [Geminella minor]
MNKKPFQPFLNTIKNFKKNYFKKNLEQFLVNNYFFKSSFYSKEYKNWAKQKTLSIFTNTTNSNFFILLLPFLLNFTQILFFKYKDQTFSVFLEKNLPGYSSPSEKFFWQTFQYLNTENLNSFQKLKRIDIYNEFILVETESLSPTFQSQLFLAYFPIFQQKSDFLSLKKNTNNQYFFPLKQNFYFLNPREFFIHSNSFFYNLDQFPLKINGSSYKNENALEKNSSINNFPEEYQGNIKNIFITSTFNKKSLFNNEKKKIFDKKKFINTKESQNLISFLQNNFQPKPNSIEGNKTTLQTKGITPLKKPNFFQKKITLNSLNSVPLCASQMQGNEGNRANLENKNTLKFIFLKKKTIKNEVFSQKNQTNNSNSFFKQKKSYFSIFSFFQNEFNNFFYKKLLQPTTNVLNSSKVEKNDFIIENRKLDLKYFFSNICSENLIQLMNDFSYKEENFILKPRVMSGYFYPDFNKKKVKSYYLEFFCKKNLNKKKILKNFNKKNLYTSNYSKIKIFLPLAFYKENFFKTNVSKMEFQYKPTFLEGVQYRQILYQGPGVVLDENTKDIFLTNKKQIHNWFKNTFYSDNPLSDRKNNFFGKKNSFSNEGIPGKFNNLEQNFHLVDKNLNVSKAKDKFFETPTMYPFFEDYRIPYLEETQWRLILEKLKAESLKNKSFNNLKEQFDFLEENQLNVSIPLIRIKYPKQKPIIWPLTLLDYYNPKSHKSSNSFVNNSLAFNEFLLKNIFKLSKNNIFIDHSSPIFIKNKNYGGIYKKIFTFYPNLKVKNNYEKNNFLKTKFLINLEEFSNLSSQEIFYKENFCFNKNVKNTIKEESTKKHGTSSVLDQNKTKNKNSKTVALSASQMHGFNFLENLEKQIFKYFSNSFYQNWQSISFLSFFIIAQFSFGFFILHILQDFYKKYGKELVSYLVDIVSSLGILDEGLKEELQLDDTEKGFRVVYKNQKQFQDIAGIDSILPELGEIVWFLRNSARSFIIGNILPKGILLIGPPGTGKTILVQAIAGEAELPVLIQSGSSLNDPDQEGIGAQKLKNLFEKARELAPCIIFIDEIDTLGEKRDSIIKNPMGADEIIESIYEFDSELKTNFQQSYEKNLFLTKTKFFQTEDEDNFLNNFQIESEESFSLQSIENSVSKNQIKQQQLSLLMQFLVELDGLQSRKGIVVIGATNRPNVLDSALTRPGRFDKVFYLDLPDKQKRIEILKLYSTNLGIEKNVSWDYFANRTFGFSAADLAAVMNESSIQAIIKDTVHTVESIEQGILFITSYSTEKIPLNLDEIKDPFYLTRLAYYQCGKALLHTLLPNHPSAIVVYLWPRPKNPRHKQFTKFLQTSFLKINYKSELEERLIGFYAGKAAELFSLINNSSKFLNNKYTISKNKTPLSIKLKTETNLKLNVVSLFSKRKLEKTPQIFNKKDLKNFTFSLYWQSDIGFEDLHSATLLSYYMIDKWYFYSKNVILKKYHEIRETKNNLEISELDILDVLNQLNVETQKNIFQEKKSLNYQQIFQEWSIRSWWQVEIIKQASFSDIFFSDWYRIYLPNPEENERNEEWVAPDQYSHNNDNLQNVLNNSKNSSLLWTNLYLIDRDYIGHSLILLCFNKAFSYLTSNREILDYFVDYLLRHEILRQSDIVNLLNKFNISIKKSELQLFNKLFLIFEKNWGQNSRKTTSHFINFEKIKYTIEKEKINFEKFKSKK